MALNCPLTETQKLNIHFVDISFHKMNTAPIFSFLQPIPGPNYPSKRSFVTKHGSDFSATTAYCPSNLLTKNFLTNSRISALDDISAVSSDPAQAELTWQIVIGALAGVTPFVVAGIEFSKRIVAQKKCNVCEGSGLVLRDNKYYFRCPGCGGFLPWQSWRRFFTG